MVINDLSDIDIQDNYLFSLVKDQCISYPSPYNGPDIDVSCSIDV